MAGPRGTLSHREEMRGDWKALMGEAALGEEGGEDEVCDQPCPHQATPRAPRGAHPLCPPQRGRTVPSQVPSGTRCPSAAPSPCMPGVPGGLSRGLQAGVRGGGQRPAPSRSLVPRHTDRHRRAGARCLSAAPPPPQLLAKRITPRCIKMSALDTEYLWTLRGNITRVPPPGT